MINDPVYKKFEFDYDVYPRVFAKGKEVNITVEAENPECTLSGEYTVQLRSMQDRSFCTAFPLTADSDGRLTLTLTFPTEQEYQIYVMRDGDIVVEHYVYAINEDLVGRYPYMGDLHVHSDQSDGSQPIPEVVANYIYYGYDFFAVTDHRRYYPSILAHKWAEENKVDIKVFPGEEVQMPVTGNHIVSFGASYSINGLYDGSPQHTDGRNAGKAINEYSTWSGNGDYPTPKSSDALLAEVAEIADTLTDLPDNVNRMSVAGCEWVFRHIREAGGISIYAHPFWRVPNYHVPIPENDWILKKHHFDAFEVLGGEEYFDQNGLQAIKYFELRREGYDFPVVGSSDCHYVNEDTPEHLIARTLVLTPNLEYGELKAALLSPEHYSIPVDARQLDFTVVASMRFAMYAGYLIQHYFPIADRVSAEIGMAAYAVARGEEGAGERLASFVGKKDGIRRKYFAF